MNYWLEPEKITESFVWFCFSRLDADEIQDCLYEYKQEFGDELREELKKRNPITRDIESTKEILEERKERRDNEIESEVIKAEKIWINKMVKKLGFDKNDYKKIVKDVMKQVIDYDKL